MFDLTGRTALVTGAGQGVGAGIASTLVSAGAAVAVNDLVPERATAVADGLDGRTAAVPFDVTDLDAVRAGVRVAEEALGPIDVLVNNAGIPTAGFPQTTFRDSDPHLWRRFVDLNLYGVLNCTHAVVGGMCDRGRGRIVTISSEAGRTGLGIGVSLYGAAKAGAVGLMRHLAVEVAPAGVTVNCLSLGLMDNVTGEWAEAVARRVPRRRLGSPADVGAAVVFLASDEADWITGQVLPVNGGTLT
jgi:NAD(P)-dependent dehydrogenase (short-subunit alcohol dehydrogenase family)